MLAVGFWSASGRRISAFPGAALGLGTAGTAGAAAADGIELKEPVSG
jgi:hypothetical protein